MEGYTVQQLLTAIGVDPERFTGQLREMRVTGLSTDSRSTRPGEVFFAIRGDRFDGASFVGEASKAGAVLAVVNASAGLRETAETPVAVVDDTIAALGGVLRLPFDVPRDRYRGDRDEREDHGQGDAPRHSRERIPGSWYEREFQ